MTSEWVVAGAETFLACGTVWLGWQARNEARAVKTEAAKVAEQVELQREQMKRSAQAYVYPFMPLDWATGSDFWARVSPKTALPLKNGGTGLARNVQGKAFWANDDSRTSFRVSTIFAGSIAPGDSVNARLSQAASPSWQGAEGYVTFTDLLGNEWVTRFKFSLGEGNQLVCEHEAAVPVAELGELGRFYPPVQ